MCKSVQQCYCSLMIKYTIMSYSCIMSWRLNKGYTTADEQPQYD